MTKKKKRKLKSLIGFHSADKIDNYNRGGEKGIKKESEEELKTLLMKVKEEGE